MVKYSGGYWQMSPIVRFVNQIEKACKHTYGLDAVRIGMRYLAKFEYGEGHMSGVLIFGTWWRPDKETLFAFLLAISNGYRSILHKVTVMRMFSMMFAWTEQAVNPNALALMLYHYNELMAKYYCLWMPILVSEYAKMLFNGQLLKCVVGIFLDVTKMSTTTHRIFHNYIRFDATSCHVPDWQNATIANISKSIACINTVNPVRFRPMSSAILNDVIWWAMIENEIIDNETNPDEYIVVNILCLPADDLEWLIHKCFIMNKYDIPAQRSTILYITLPDTIKNRRMYVA